MDRRSFLQAGAAAVAIGGTISIGGAHASPLGVGDDAAIEFPPGVPVPKLSELLAAEARLTGNLPAYQSEVERAAAILESTPSATTPFEVANYFLRLNQGEFGSSDFLYAREWPVRANPVIVSFFDATTLRTPEGDVTAWCAAFVNWCIVRARDGRDASGLLAPTHSAASRTFREWGSQTNTPVPGDLVVFRNNEDGARGHVAFYLAETPATVFILGGNQRSSARVNNGEVNIAAFAKNGNTLTFHSYRTDPSLHA